MGWDGRYLGHNPSSAERKAMLDADFTWSDANADRKIIKSTMKGSTYYGVMEITRPGMAPKRIAVVALTSYEDGEFYVKSMDESMGPYYYDMPPSYLELLTPADNEESLKWREKVRENADVRKRKWEDRKWTINSGPEIPTDKFVKELSYSTGYPGNMIENTRWIKGMKPGEKGRVRDVDFERTYDLKSRLSRKGSSKPARKPFIPLIRRLKDGN